jgi:Helix-turn-helix domain
MRTERELHDTEIATVGQALGHPHRAQIIRHLAMNGPVAPAEFAREYKLSTSVAALTYHFHALKRLGVAEPLAAAAPRAAELHAYRLGGPYADAAVHALDLLEQRRSTEAGTTPARKNRRDQPPEHESLPGERPGDGEYGSQQIDWRKIAGPLMSRLEIALLGLPEGTDLASAEEDETLSDLLPRDADLDLGSLNRHGLNLRERQLDRYVGRRPIDWWGIARIIMTQRRIGILEVLALDGGRSLTTREICLELQEERSQPISTEIRHLREAGWVVLAGKGISEGRGAKGYLYKLHPSALMDEKLRPAAVAEVAGDGAGTSPARGSRQDRRNGLVTVGAASERS